MRRMASPVRVRPGPIPEAGHHILRFYLMTGLVALTWFLFLRFFSSVTEFTTTSTALLGVSVVFSVFGVAACSRRMLHGARGWENLPVAALFLALLSLALIALPAPIVMCVRAVTAQPLGPYGPGAIFGSLWFCAIVACQVVATRWYAILPLFVLTYGALKWAAGRG
jgi:hypothetical protein